jgi:hypothetical protein
MPALLSSLVIAHHRSPLPATTRLKLWLAFLVDLLLCWQEVVVFIHASAAARPLLQPLFLETSE